MATYGKLKTMEKKLFKNYHQKNGRARGDRSARSSSNTPQLLYFQWENLFALERKLVSRLREMVIATVVSNLVTIHLRSCKLS